MKHQVKSFVLDVTKGLEKALEDLDDLVFELGEVKIVSVRDYDYPSCPGAPETSRTIVRVVVFTDKAYSDNT